MNTATIRKHSNISGWKEAKRIRRFSGVVAFNRTCGVLIYLYSFILLQNPSVVAIKTQVVVRLYAVSVYGRILFLLEKQKCSQYNKRHKNP